MGNSVSAHIYETKVFRPYPVILYRLRLDPSIHWWKKIGVPRNDFCHIYETKVFRPYPVILYRLGGLRQLYCLYPKSPSKINGK